MSLYSLISAFAADLMEDHSSAMGSLGQIYRKQKDWFDENDEEIQGLLEE